MLWGRCCDDLVRATWGRIHPEPGRRDCLPGVEIYFDERYLESGLAGSRAKELCANYLCHS